MQTELDQVRSELTNLESTVLRLDITCMQVQKRKLKTALADAACQNDSLRTQNADLAAKRDEQEETVKEQVKEVDSARLQFIRMKQERKAAKAEVEGVTKARENLLQDMSSSKMCST